ncbi:MAG: cytochrome c5 family protein [bacterium]|nr:cytochrome c5 family protein [bacterium]
MKIPKQYILISAVLALSLATAHSTAAEPGLAPRQARIFSRVCAHCHMVPSIAPVPGSDVEWGERRKKGFEKLVANAITGVGNMPPLGTCSFCSEDDMRKLVSFLTGLEK